MDMPRKEVLPLYNRNLTINAYYFRRFAQYVVLLEYSCRGSFFQSIVVHALHTGTFVFLLGLIRDDYILQRSNS